VLAYAEPAEAAPAGSDAALLAEGFATVTALRATAELEVAELDASSPSDATHHGATCRLAG